jgi:hypothetical protein
MIFHAVDHRWGRGVGEDKGIQLSQGGNLTGIGHSDGDDEVIARFHTGREMPRGGGTCETRQATCFLYKGAPIRVRRQVVNQVKFVWKMAMGQNSAPVNIVTGYCNSIYAPHAIGKYTGFCCENAEILNFILPAFSQRCLVTVAALGLLVMP